MQEASETSEIETVNHASALFSVDVNLENLQMHLDQIRILLKSYDHRISGVDRGMKQRATEKAMGMYLERMSHAIPKTLGSRPHAFKLDDPSFFEQEFDTEHGQLLKSGVEKMIEKLEIMSSVCMKNKKFKNKATERLDKLESSYGTYVSKDLLAFELEKIEKRISGFITEQLQKQTERIIKNEDLLNEAMTKFDKQLNDYRSQVLWRIKDCEELLKNRVAAQELQD